jgi:hypothetical protein
MKTYKQFLNEEQTPGNSWGPLDQSIMLMTELLKNKESLKLNSKEPIQSIRILEDVKKDTKKVNFEINEDAGGFYQIEFACTHGPGMKPQCKILKVTLD